MLCEKYPRIVSGEVDHVDTLLAQDYVNQVHMTSATRLLNNKKGQEPWELFLVPYPYGL